LGGERAYRSCLGSGVLDLEERVRPKFEPRALIAQVECND
jgi:hypothetical protein